MQRLPCSQWAGKNKRLPSKETPAQRKARIEKEHMDALQANLEDD
jgi:hypothetical protein